MNKPKDLGPEQTAAFEAWWASIGSPNGEAWREQALIAWRAAVLHCASIAAETDCALRCRVGSELASNLLSPSPAKESEKV